MVGVTGERADLVPHVGSVRLTRTAHASHAIEYVTHRMRAV
jgi:hypothetical protein